MSEDPRLPPTGGNGGSGGTATTVSPGMGVPAALYVGVPCTVRGTASVHITIINKLAAPAAITPAVVTLTFDGTAIPTVSDGGDAVNGWNWHAVVTPESAGEHTLVATATLGTISGSQTGHVQASPMLSIVSPVSALGYFSLENIFTVQVASTSVFNMEQAGSAWQCQLAPGGAAGPPAAIGHTPGQDTWQITTLLPAVQVPAGGTQYTLTITATTAVAVASGTQNVSLPVSAPMLAVDRTAPVFLAGTSIPAQVSPGATPVVTVQVTDTGNQRVFSGVPPNGVTVQFDGQQVAPVTQTVTGDPGTWTATLPPVTQAAHTVTLTATDVAGNVAHQTGEVSVLLQSWTRLEPSPRDPTLTEGLQARVADPAWLLARQAAFGELAGTDNAAPVVVRMRARASALTRLRPAYQAGTTTPATGPGALLPAGGGPLEALTEAEPEPGPGGPSRPLFAVQAGLHYRRLLRRAVGAGNLATYEQGLAQAYPVKTALAPPAANPPPAAGQPPLPQAADPALLPYLAGQIPDGERLYADLAATLRPPGSGTLPAAPPLGTASPAVVTSVAKEWLAWYDAVRGAELGATDTWRPDRMEYAFSIAAPGPDKETVLAAAELDTGRLDWHDFDLLASGDVTGAAGVSLGAVPADLPGGEAGIVYAGVPKPVRFRGMPSQSWWQFDDGSIDFGAVTAPVESLTTSVMVEFAMRYGNDHFLLPVQLPVGSVLRVDSLVVVDTFGEVLLVNPVAVVDGATGPFRLFEHSVPGASAPRDPLLVLFPALGGVIEGMPVEEVHFLRDDAAELVWAVEHTALGANGLPADRAADALAHFTPLTPTPNGAAALPVRRYQLRSDVEANWFPFLVTDPAAGNVLAMADVPPLDTTPPIPPTPVPWGRILAPFAPVPGAQGPGPGLPLPAEEVSPAGVQVRRAWRYARWSDGRQLCWVSRRVRPGTGPGASGLTFDLAL
jgi:hypothetical protein